VGCAKAMHVGARPVDLGEVLDRPESETSLRGHITASAVSDWCRSPLIICKPPTTHLPSAIDPPPHCSGSAHAVVRAIRRVSRRSAHATHRQRRGLADEPSDAESDVSPAERRPAARTCHNIAMHRSAQVITG